MIQGAKGRSSEDIVLKAKYLEEGQTYKIFIRVGKRIRA